MKQRDWTKLGAYAAAAFFVIGSFGNIFPPASVVTDYARWGYPAWFHYVTGALELMTAALLARRPTRLLGAALGSAIMASAIGTVVFHGEYSHAILPAVVLAGVAILAIATATRRNATRTA